MRIAICDSDDVHRSYIRELVTKFFSEMHINIKCSEFENGEALQCYGDEYDIVFMDIDMGQMDGLKITKEIIQRGGNKKTLYFIITEKRKYLDDAMDMNVFRFIDKPACPDRICTGLRKALEFIDTNSVIFRTRNDGIVTLRKNEIIYVEVLMKKVYVYTNSKEYLTREKMDYFKTVLTGSNFAVPHNSYLVNLRFVTEFKRESLLLNNGTTITIAPKRQAFIKKKFLKFISFS